MDEGAVGGQRCPRGLMDAGWRTECRQRHVAVILGNALGGEAPQLLHASGSPRSSSVRGLPTLLGVAGRRPAGDRRETRSAYLDNTFEITEDTMPGELANVTAAASAICSTSAAPTSRPMPRAPPVSGALNARSTASSTISTTPSSPVASIATWAWTPSSSSARSAFSATGTRPFDAGADGFVMGEGAAHSSSSSGSRTPSGTATVSIRSSRRRRQLRRQGQGITAPTRSASPSSRGPARLDARGLRRHCDVGRGARHLDPVSATPPNSPR